MSSNRYKNLTVDIGDNDNKHEIIKTEDEFLKNQILASQGEKLAQQNLGVFYYTGYSVPIDRKEALAWFIRAAMQGLTVSQFNAGCLYTDINNDFYNPKQGAFWFEQAALQGHASAQCNLAVCYQFGLGVDQDILKAIEWFQLAARQGHARSKNALLDFVNNKAWFDLLKTTVKDKLITEWPVTIDDYSAKDREIINLILSLNAAEGERKLKDALIQTKLKDLSIGREQPTHVQELIGFYAAGLFKPKDQPRQQDQPTTPKINNGTRQPFRF